MTNSNSLQIGLDAGQALFVLGANGAGKSHLMYGFYRQHAHGSARITAHRPNYMHTSGVDLTPGGRKNALLNLFNSDGVPSSVWYENDPHTRNNVTLFDLANAENTRARKIAAAVDEKRDSEARRLSDGERPPVQVINELLLASNLPLTISIDADTTFKVSKADSAPYGINQLSDGERNAVLLAGRVLTAPVGTLFLIDEPERHLHRSIVSPLLRHLFATRQDCAFIVSTHDVPLAIDSPTARILLVRGVAFVGEQSVSWDFDLVDSPDEIDDTIKADILGARRRTLFVEGSLHTLDKRLYSIVFGDVSVIPRATCRDVEKTVTAIRAANNLHWVEAFGIVDSDGRTPDDIAQLRDQGIHAVPTYSVEALYYHPGIQAAVARRKAASEGGDAAKDVDAAKKGALEAITRQAQHLARRRARLTVRHLLLQAVPTAQNIADSAPVKIDIDPMAILAEEQARIRSLVTKGDLLAILTRYPVRESGMLKSVARALRFASTPDYETAVLKALTDEAATLQIIRSLFADLVAALALPRLSTQAAAAQ